MRSVFGDGRTTTHSSKASRRLWTTWICYSACLATHFSMCSSTSTMDFCIQGWMWWIRVANSVSNFWTWARETNVTHGSINFYELGALQVACEEDAEVGSTCFGAARLATWSSSTVSAKFSFSEGTSILGPLCGAATVPSSLKRPISIVPASCRSITISNWHSCIHAHLKDKAWEGVGGDGLKFPLMYHLQQ